MFSEPKLIHDEERHFTAPLFGAINIGGKEVQHPVECKRHEPHRFGNLGARFGG